MQKCECGCGKEVGLYTNSRPERGQIKGQYRRFIIGHNNRLPLAKRFWDKVSKLGPLKTASLGNCWVWDGAKSERGYGILWNGKKLVRATHVAHFLIYGVWPTLPMLHRCDTPPCVRFSHLHEGTQKQNMREAVDRGLLINPKGEQAPKAKLTSAQVEIIRKEYAKGKTTHRKLAKKYGVNHSSIGALIRRSHWSSI